MLRKPLPKVISSVSMLGKQFPERKGYKERGYVLRIHFMITRSATCTTLQLMGRDFGMYQLLEHHYACNVRKHQPCHVHVWMAMGRHSCECILSIVVHTCSIDATTETKRKGKYANHSKIHPNAITKSIVLEGEPRLYFVATMNIKDGEEILYDYQDRDTSTIRANPWLRK